MESSGNSTIQTLDGSGSLPFIEPSNSGFYTHIYEGTAQNTENYSSVGILCVSDKAGILKIFQSIDCIIWDLTDSYTYPSTELGLPLYVHLSIKAKWLKIQYVNTSDETCNIRIQTILHSDILTSIGDINIGNVTVSNTPLPITGTVNVNTVPSYIWQSDEINNQSVYNTSKILESIHCVNFAPDYRFIKLYDTSSEPDLSDRPKLTLPITADIPYSVSLKNGILFSNGIWIKVTRCSQYNDINIAETGDVHLWFTYKDG